MNRITSLALTMAVGLTLAHPVALFADHDDKKDDGGNGNGGKHGQNAAPQRHMAAPAHRSLPAEINRGPAQHERQDRMSVNRSYQQAPRSSFNRDNETISGQAAVHRSSSPQINISTTARSVARVDHSATRTHNRAFSSYTRKNNYGGRWFPANTHGDWDRNRDYYWNNHRYSWYNDGWLIVDDGYWPSDDAYYAYSSGSTAAGVQASLAHQGYYRGPIDGDIGPASRRAIATYQEDNGLAVTGSINDALLTSLGMR